MSNSIKKANIKLIDQIKKSLKDINVADLCTFLSYSRQNLHYHLEKKNLESASKSDQLLRISKAVATQKEQLQKAASQKVKVINKTLATA